MLLDPAWWVSHRSRSFFFFCCCLLSSFLLVFVLCLVLRKYINAPQTMLSSLAWWSQRCNRVFTHRIAARHPIGTKLGTTTNCFDTASQILNVNFDRAGWQKRVPRDGRTSKLGRRVAGGKIESVCGIQFVPFLSTLTVHLSPYAGESPMLYMACGGWSAPLASLPAQPLGGLCLRR